MAPRHHMVIQNNTLATLTASPCPLFSDSSSFLFLPAAQLCPQIQLTSGSTRGLTEKRKSCLEMGQLRSRALCSS